MVQPRAFSPQPEYRRERDIDRITPLKNNNFMRDDDDFKRRPTYGQPDDVIPRRSVQD